MTHTFRLRPDPADLPYWAAQYDYPAESAIEQTLAPAAKARGYLTHAELFQLCRWKSPRIQSRCGSNPADFVEAVTGMALNAAHERLRIEGLMLLSGVAWPMASVILHWCHPEPYPILDFRALWTLGFATPPTYTFTFWWDYTQFARALAASAGLSMRALDRALWGYSKAKQS